MVIVAPESSAVVGVKATVSLTLGLFKRRSRGAMLTLAAETEVAETCGSNTRCSVVAAAIKQVRLYIAYRNQTKTFEDTV